MGLGHGNFNVVELHACMIECDISFFSVILSLGSRRGVGLGHGN